VNGPRLVLNATLAGLYGALLLAAALSVLHPGIPATDVWLGLSAVVGIYAVAAGLAWPLLYAVVRFFASRSLAVPLLSLRYMMSFSVANTAVILAALGDLLASHRKAIDSAATIRLRFLLGAVALAWLYGLVVCVVPRFKRSVPLLASAAGLALAALIAPLLVSLPGAEAAERPEPAAPAAVSDVPAMRGRLVILAFDGADLEDILRLQAGGRLPVLTRLRREGSHGRLQGVIPCDTAAARAILATGQLPYKNGVRGPRSRDLLGRALGLTVVPGWLWFDGFMAPVMRTRRLTIENRSVPALWDLAQRTGGEAVIGGWDVDFDMAGPAPPVDAARRRALASEFMEGDPSAASDPAIAAVLDELARAIDADAASERRLEAAASLRGPGIVAIAFPGIDRVAHLFLRAARPEVFGDVSSAERERQGGVLTRYYERLETFVTRGQEIAGPDGWLFVVSSHGMEPAPLARRLVGLAHGPVMPGSHDGAPAGLLIARGPEIGRGVPFGRAATTDLVPTALHLLGLPVARDLDGSIIEQMFVPDGTLDRPAVIIDTYGSRP
jgi:type I phosphodiesterase/nucleotide pyrophosphatase